MQRQRILLWIFLLVSALSLGWQIGEQVERKRHQVQIAAFEERFGLTGSGVTFREDPEQEVDLTLLWTVWRMLDRHYVDPEALTIDKLREGMVRGLVRAVGDPYSAFMTQKENTDFQQSLQGELEGIGAELTMRDGVIVVVTPLKKSPAERAGLLPKDMIIKVDETSTENMSLHDAVQIIRGPKGTEVILTVFRPSTSEELAIPITRDKIQVPSVEYEVLETATGSVGLLTLNQFGETTVREAHAALQEFGKEDIAGLILDLRFNGGGYLDGSIAIASFFLKTEKIVSVHRRGEEIESHYARGDALMPLIPMVVLINEGSASASEIVAGALRDHKRATVIGAKSFGKGTVQEVIDLPGGSSLRVTIAKWKTPNGKDLSKEGVTPDYEVPMDMQDYVDEKDSQKEAALEYLLDGEIDVVEVSGQGEGVTE